MRGQKTGVFWFCIGLALEQRSGALTAKALEQIARQTADPVAIGNGASAALAPGGSGAMLGPGRLDRLR